MSECMCIEVDVSDLRVATINSFEICALCSLPSVRRISTICHKQGRASVNKPMAMRRTVRAYSTCNANMRRLDATEKGHALEATYIVAFKDDDES